MNIIGYYNKPEKIAGQWIDEMYEGENQDNKEILQTKIKHFLWVHNGCNAASVIASPLAGIIRIIMGIALHKMVKNYEGNITKEAQPQMKTFASKEIARGVLEFLGMGLVISIIEVLAAHVFKCSCVDAKKGEVG